MKHCCVKRYAEDQELLDDETFVYCPHRVGRNILICGRKNSHFPLQCFVGPDWRCMLVTYCLITVPTVLFINNIARHWHVAVVVITVLLLSATLSFYSYTACSDPGIVYKLVDKTEEARQMNDPEEAIQSVNTMECGICKIDRPRNASHCYDCGLCIVDLDHHCPWTGKCIGKKTFRTFQGFLASLMGLISFVVLMVVVTAIRGTPIFNFD